MPAYIINIKALEHNAELLRHVADEAGANIVLALKGFSTWGTFSSLRDFADGCCASGVWEAELARDCFGGKILTYAPAYSDDEMPRLMEISHHLDFNSVQQWMHFREAALSHERFIDGSLHFGLRVNPQISTGPTAIYDPCIPGSRLGIVASNLESVDLTGISGLHMHTLCEQGAEDLQTTILALEERFGKWLSLPEIKWVNFGGGHWITKSDYNRDLLIDMIRKFRERYAVDVWLEPGEAFAIHTGVLRCRVLDVFESEGYNHAILDVSASAHMPDVLEMPYRPDVFQVGTDDSILAESLPAVVMEGEFYLKAGMPEELEYTYRLGSSTCLSGDVIGDFSFEQPLMPGDELVFDDMSHYTMVKTTFFNGIRHPDIKIQRYDGSLETVRTFSYADYKSRLG